MVTVEPGAGVEKCEALTVFVEGEPTGVLVVRMLTVSVEDGSAEELESKCVVLPPYVFPESDSELPDGRADVDAAVLPP
jgi:hypothetical protein